MTVRRLGVGQLEILFGVLHAGPHGVPKRIGAVGQQDDSLQTGGRRPRCLPTGGRRAGDLPQPASDERSTAASSVRETGHDEPSIGSDLSIILRAIWTRLRTGSRTRKNHLRERTIQRALNLLKTSTQISPPIARQRRQNV